MAVSDCARPALSGAEFAGYPPHRALADVRRNRCHAGVHPHLRRTMASARCLLLGAEVENEQELWKTADLRGPDRLRAVRAAHGQHPQYRHRPTLASPAGHWQGRRWAFRSCTTRICAARCCCCIPRVDYFSDEISDFLEEVGRADRRRLPKRSQRRTGSLETSKKRTRPARTPARGAGKDAAGRDSGATWPR